MNEHDAKLKLLDERFPLVPHTGRGQLYSTVRRMKAEKEAGIPIDRRTGFAISVKHGKAASELTEANWEEFYESLCSDLRNRYPEMHEQLFD